jgi:hypothetical protein
MSENIVSELQTRIVLLPVDCFYVSRDCTVETANKQ